MLPNQIPVSSWSGLETTLLPNQIPVSCWSGLGTTLLPNQIPVSCWSGLVNCLVPWMCGGYKHCSLMPLLDYSFISLFWSFLLLIHPRVSINHEFSNKSF